MKRPVPRKCRHCKKFFLPDSRNARHQKYCCEPECQRASRQAAQAKWRAGPKGRDYFKGSVHVGRVRDWRAKRRKAALEAGGVLQDIMIAKRVEAQEVEGCRVVLQDVCLERHPLIIGLISQISGVLQDDIASVLQSLHSRGQRILGKGPGIANQN